MNFAHIRMAFQDYFIALEIRNKKFVFYQSPCENNMVVRAAKQLLSFKILLRYEATTITTTIIETI